MPANRSRRRGHTRLTVAALMAPLVLLLLLFRAWPVANAIYLSMTKWDGVNAPQWIGSANYRYMLHDPVFYQALRNNVLILLAVPVWVLVPLVVAAMLYNGLPLARTFRLMLFFPVVLSPVVIGVYYSIALRYDGPLNSLLGSLGLSGLRREWLYSPSTALLCVIAVLIWSTMGIGILIFMSALANVDDNLYEAAILDGASATRRFWHITMPQVRPAIEYWTIIVLSATFTSLFPYIYALTHGGPGYDTYTLDYYVYDTAFGNNAAGYASAIGVVLLAIGFILAFSQILVLRRSGR
jgi:ABC-type sugar transport system permease subunit